jgi:drug/metabolite transporter (DMT)-like permease
MDRLIGVFLVALSAACFGTNAVFARIGYDAGANPCTFLFIRFVIASLVMFLIVTVRGLNFPKGRLLVSLALIGGIGLAGATFSFYTAIQLAPTNLVIVIAYMYPTMVTLLAAMLLKQPITTYKIVALVMTVFGILFTIGLDSGGYFLGIMLAVLTAIYCSLYLVLGSKFIQRAGPFPASTVIIIAVALIYSVLVGLQGLQMPMIPSGWLAIVASALISTVLGIMALFAGLKRIDTANAAIISTFEVVVVVALSVIILGETITLHKVLGACLVIGAVIILTRSEYRTAQAQIR